MTTEVKCETIPKAGWMGLKRFSGTLDAADSKFVVPIRGLTPTMAVSVKARVDSSTGNALFAYFDPATSEIQVYSATGTKKTSGTIWFDLVVMGDL